MNEETELLCCKLISAVGTARSCYAEAIQKAKEQAYEEAQQLIEQGNEFFHQGHKIHAETIQYEAKGNHLSFSLLIVHAEDQLMSAEVLKILCEDFIELYRRTENRR